jgi:hypothetical protein
MTLMVTETGEEHGLINTVANSVKDEGFKHMTPENKAKAEKMRKEDSKKVKARYINHRGDHERLTKPYMRWAGDPITMWHFIPNEVYEVPMGLVNEINSSGLVQRSELYDVHGKSIPRVDGKKDKIHEFVPCSF